MTISVAFKQRVQTIQNSDQWVRDSRIGFYTNGYYRKAWVWEAVIHVIPDADAPGMKLRFTGPDSQADGYVEWFIVGEGKRYRRDEEANLLMAHAGANSFYIKGSLVSDYDSYWFGPEYRAIEVSPKRIVIDDNSWIKAEQV